MKSTQIAQIKKALIGAEGKRLEKLAAAQWGPPEHFSNPDSRSAAAKVFVSALRTLGGSSFSARALRDQFGEIVARDQAKLMAAAGKAKAASVKNSRAAYKLLATQAAARLQGLKDLVALPADEGSPRYQLLNEPFLIWPTNSVDLEASEIVPSDSWAKFRVATEDSFYGDVKFYYLWQNPDNAYAVINVSGYAIFHGHVFVGVGGGLCPGNRFASISVDGRLDILEWWNQPPTQPMQQADQSVNVLTLKVSAPGFSEVGALDARDIFRGYDLRYQLMIVPPSSVLVFTVTASVNCSNGQDSGRTEVDFASGDFRVGSPAVLVTILS